MLLREVTEVRHALERPAEVDYDAAVWRRQDQVVNYESVGNSLWSILEFIIYGRYAYDPDNLSRAHDGRVNVDDVLQPQSHLLRNEVEDHADRDRELEHGRRDEPSQGQQQDRTEPPAKLVEGDTAAVINERILVRFNRAKDAKDQVSQAQQEHQDVEEDDEVAALRHRLDVLDYVDDCESQVDEEQYGDNDVDSAKPLLLLLVLE